MNSYAFDLDLDKRFNDQVVIIGQSDHDGTQLTVTLYKNSQRFTQSGLTAYFAMRLPDGKNYYRKQGSYSNGVVTVTIDEEYAGAASGRTDVAYFELHQKNNQGTSTVIASTARFLVIVLPSATQGMAEGQRYDDEIAATVRAWLNEHPEATTTVTDNSLTTNKIKDRQITEPKMADSAVSTRTIVDGNVTTAKLADVSVTDAKLAANSVTNEKMADGAVGTAELVDGAATTDKIADSAVTALKIAQNAVTNEKMADDAVNTTEIVNLAVTTAKIADSAVNADKVAPNAITGPKIADGSVTYSKLDGVARLTNAQIDAMF